MNRTWNSAHRYEVSLLSQLLVLLVGLEDSGCVAVLRTTNRLGAIDPALLRPGRLDYQIEVPLPDRSGREAILTAHLDELTTAEIDNLDAIARITNGWSGAELAAICREAGVAAIRRALAQGREPQEAAISSWDLSCAVQTVVAKWARRA